MMVRRLSGVERIFMAFLLPEFGLFWIVRDFAFWSDRLVRFTGGNKVPAHRKPSTNQASFDVSPKMNARQ
jgi:hypothetical protein